MEPVVDSDDDSDFGDKLSMDTDDEVLAVDGVPLVPPALALPQPGVFGLLG